MSEYRHAVTGRAVNVSEGTRTARLVQADDNWTEAPKRRRKRKADAEAVEPEEVTTDGPSDDD